MPTLLVPIQILLLLFIIFAFSRVLLRLREGTITSAMFIFWTIIWALATLGVLSPEATTQIANRIGIGRGADLMIYSSLVLLFYLVYRTNVLLENLRHELTQLVRKLALQEKSGSQETTKKRKRRLPKS